MPLHRKRPGLNPVWEHGNVVDLLVYEPQQKARISVFDKEPAVALWSSRWEPQHQLPLVRAERAGNIRPVAEEVADIARRLLRAKHSVQEISDITGLEPWQRRDGTQMTVGERIGMSIADVTFAR
eukprot:Skav203580  [mRNA]  locus=scaffold935:82794:84547:+ [translate_table: standard]